MTVTTQPGFYERNMPPSSLPPIFPCGPLNLNDDGSTITYRKSHQGPHTTHWAQADAEEMERLFKSGTLRPILFCDIPAGQQAAVDAGAPAAVVAAMRAHAGVAYVAGCGCWVLHNISLLAAGKAAVLAEGGRDVIAAAVRDHPFAVEWGTVALAKL